MRIPFPSRFGVRNTARNTRKLVQALSFFYALATVSVMSQAATEARVESRKSVASKSTPSHSSVSHRRASHIRGASGSHHAPKTKRLGSAKRSTKKTTALATPTDRDDNSTGYADHPAARRFAANLAARSALREEAIVQALAQARSIPAVLRLTVPSAASSPPVRDWSAYRARFLNPERIAFGQEFMKLHAAPLRRAEQTYGVPGEIIAAILGVETVYGRHTGSFRVIDALATLAFDYPAHGKPDRQVYFQEQLGELLLLSQDLRIEPTELKGSYAGAIGVPQFMPGSYREFGVDFDEDGTIDLRNSVIDAIGSVGYFLMAHGWLKNVPPIVSDAPLPAKASSMVAGGLDPTLNRRDLEKLQIARPSLPDEVRYGVIDLPNADGSARYVLGTDNFFVLTRYNRSYFYAMSVVELAQAIAAAHPPSRF